MFSGRKAVRVTSKIFLWLIVLFMVLFASVWIILKVPAVQNFLTTKATSYISNKTHTRVELTHIDLGFPKSILLQGIFLEDTNHDTLVSINEIDINLNMWELFSKTISIESLVVDDFHVRLRRTEKDSTFNFQFLVDAFSSDNEKDVKKDTTDTGSAWTIKANAIALTHGRFDMVDAVSGLTLNLSAGEIQAQLNKLDLDKSIVDLGEIDLSDVHGIVRNTKPAAVSTDTTSSWNGIYTSGLTIQRSSFDYSDKITSMLISANIGSLELKNTSIDLIRQHIASDGLSIAQSSSIIQLIKSTDTTTSKSTSPGWNIQLSSLDLKDNAFKMDMLNEKAIPSGIDWNHLALTEINTSTQNIVYNGPLIEATIESLSAQDKSGFGIRSLETKAYMDATKASLIDLNLVTNHSQLGQNIQVNYTSLDEIMSSMKVNCSMKNSQVAVEDLLLLVPSLDSIDIIHKNKNRVADFNLIASGDLKKLDIQQLYFKTLNSSIDTKGVLKNLSDVDKLFIDLRFNRIQTGAADIAFLLPDSTVPSSIHIPSEVFLKGNYKGTLSDFQSTLDMSSSMGSAFVRADINGLKNEIPTYKLTLQAHSLNLGALLAQSSIGKLNGAVDLTGSGFDTSNISAIVQTDITSIELNGYNFQNIHIDGKMDKLAFTADGSVDDENIKFSFDTKANLNSSQEYYDLQLALKGADLQALGFTKEHVTISANTDLHLIGDPSKNINGHITTRNILVIQNGKRYKEDSLVLISINEPGKSNVKLNSSMLAASFDGNIDVLTVGDAITNHLNRYFHFSDNKYKETSPQNFAFEVKYSQILSKKGFYQNTWGEWSG